MDKTCRAIIFGQGGALTGVMDSIRGLVGKKGIVADPTVAERYELKVQGIERQVKELEDQIALAKNPKQQEALYEDIAAIVQKDLHSIRKQIDGATILAERMEKTKDIRSVRGIWDVYFGEITEMVARDEHAFQIKVEGAINKAGISGQGNAKQVKDAIDLYYISRDNPAHFIDRISKLENVGLERAKMIEETLFWEGNYTGKSMALNILAHAKKDIDKVFESEMNRNSSLFRARDGYDGPAAVDKLRVKEMTQDEFLDDMISNDRIDWEKMSPEKTFTDAEKTELLKSLYERWRDPSNVVMQGKATNFLNRRNIEFKNMRTFLRKYGNLRHGWFHQLAKHQLDKIREASYFRLIGDNSNEYVESMEEIVRARKDFIRTGDDATKETRAASDTLKGMGNQQKRSLDIRMGRKTEADEAGYDAGTIINNIVAGSLLGKAVVRSLVYDQSFVTAMVRSAKFNEGYFKSLAATTWDLFKWGVLQPRRMAEIAETLEANRIGTMFSMGQMALGNAGRRSNTSDGVLGAAKDVYKSYAAAFKTKGVGGKVQQLTETHAMITSRLSLADHFFKASRVANFIAVNRWVGQGFSSDWNALSRASDGLLKDELKSFGIGESEFNLIRAAKDWEAHEGSYLGKNLENLFEGVSDDVLLKAARAGESVEAVARRVEDSYSRFLNSQLDELVARTRSFSNVVDPNSFFSHWTRFLNINVSQWYNMQKATHQAIGLDGGVSGAFGTGAHAMWANRKNPALYAAYFLKLAPMMLVGGTIVNSFQDILGGLEPRDPTQPENMLSAFGNAGSMGALAYMASNVQFKGDLLNNPGFDIVTNMAKVGVETGRAVAGEDEFDDADWRKANRLIKHLLPGGNIWFNGAIIDKIMEEGGVLEESSHQRRIRKERGSVFDPQGQSRQDYLIRRGR